MGIVGGVMYVCGADSGVTTSDHVSDGVDWLIGLGRDFTAFFILFGDLC